jgi:molecular chaperone DnaK
MDTILGIDLGTTNSEVAVLRDGQPVVLTDDGDPILPSVVGLGPDGRLLVGRPAQNQWVLAPERTVKSVKRRMGQDAKVALGEQSYTPQEISAMILRSLRDRAAAQGVEAKRAVITVPAYFNDAQRGATREAGELAGLEVVRILNEPTAAALAYDPRRHDRRLVAVYDLGGGTFDVSIVLAEGGVVEVLASHGDTHLGGDDFDELLFNLLNDRFKRRHGIDLGKNVAARARLLRAAEAAKRHLSDHPFAKVEEEFVAEKNGVALHLADEVMRDEYEELISPLIDRTMDCVRRALEDAKLAPREIDEVVLVGGSTRTPLVAERLENRLNQPARREVNPDLIVALGAALQGGLIAGQDVGAVLVDITPHSLGIRCVDELPGFGMPFLHRFATIVPRNTPLPTSRSELFRTVHVDQTAVEVEVFQGEDPDVRNNTSIGKFLIDGLAPGPAGNVVGVQLDLTLDGTLKVSAREKATGLSKQIVIDNALARFARENRGAARDRINRLWEDAFGLPEPLDADGDDAGEPALDPGPREGAREAVQAKALLEKAERLLEQAQPEDRPELERLMAGVRDGLQARDWARLEAAGHELADALFYLEDV